MSGRLEDLKLNLVTELADVERMMQWLGGQLYAWANRSDARWPCSALAQCDMVAVTFDRQGDLVDLQVIIDGKDSDADDLTGYELTAWTDDVRADQPFSR